jgi:S-adenosylmethionine decarboxylase
VAPLDTLKSENEPRDYFVERDGERFAGSHFLVDLWGAKNLTDIAAVERILHEAATDAAATILHSHFHRFSENDGISGVLVLAESHISIHTWPERDFAAIDVFMCGNCDPANSIPALRRGFSPESITVKEERRGVPR